MPPIELGPARPIGAIDSRISRQTGLSGGRPARTQAPEPAVVTSEALDPGAAPVDGERVNVIRKAIETGNYPVVPTRIADAMIAAGMLLRSAKQ